MSISLSNMICPLCPEAHTSFLHLTFPEYLKHLELFHSHRPDFLVTCGIGGCVRTFTNLRTYRNHVSGLHSGAGCFEEEADINAEISDDNSSSDHDSIDPDDVNVNVNVTERNDINTLLRLSAAYFILITNNIKKKKRMF